MEDGDLPHSRLCDEEADCVSLAASELCCTGRAGSLAPLLFDDKPTQMPRNHDGRLVGAKSDYSEAWASFEAPFATRIHYMHKGAQINLLKAAASTEKTLRQYLNCLQRCEVNRRHAAASGQEVRLHPPQVVKGAQINLLKAAAYREETSR